MPSADLTSTRAAQQPAAGLQAPCRRSLDTVASGHQAGFQALAHLQAATRQASAPRRADRSRGRAAYHATGRWLRRYLAESARAWALAAGVPPSVLDTEPERALIGVSPPPPGEGCQRSWQRNGSGKPTWGLTALAGARSVAHRGSVLLAEDLLLLVTDDASGRLLAPAAQVDAGLGGANLAELTLLNKVELSGEGEAGKAGRIVVRDSSPAGDEVLDAALELLIAHQGSKPSAVIRPLSKNLRDRLYERLAASGVVRAGQARILGIFPAHTWPAQDAHHEAQVRLLLTQVLVQQQAPDARSAALIALVHALRCEDKIVDPRPYGLSRRQLKARAEEIAKGNWASEAVRKAITEIIAAVAATTAAAVAAGGG